MRLHRPDKVAVIRVGMDLSGSDWGHDLTQGPAHILQNGGLEQLLRSRFHGRYEQYDINATPSVAQRPRQEIAYLDDILRVSREVQKLSQRLFNEGVFVVLLGGEQTVDLGFVAGAATSTRNGCERILSVSSLDGHLDCNTPETSGTDHIHGQTLASHCGHGLQALVDFHANGQPRVRGENVVVFGPNIRNKPFFTGQSTNYDDPIGMARREQAYKDEPANADRWGIRMIPAHEFDDQVLSKKGNIPLWLRNARRMLRDILGKTNGHLVLCDMDHLRETYAPGVAMPNPEGIGLEQSLRLCEYIAKRAREKLMGVAIVEADPDKDIGNKTALAATQFVDVLTR